MYSRKNVNNNQRQKYLWFETSSYCSEFHTYKIIFYELNEVMCDSIIYISI